MHVCIFGSYPPPYGGIATVNREHTKILTKQGDFFTIIMLSSYLQQNYLKEKSSNMIIHRVRLSKKSVFLQTIRHLVFNVKKFFELKKFFGTTNAIIYLGFYIESKRFLKNGAVDVIHSHHANNPQSLVASWIASEINVPFLLSIYGETRRTSGVATMKYIAEKADHIISCSKYCKSGVVDELGIKENKISIIYPSVDIEIYKPDEERDEIKKRYNVKGPLILFAGILLEMKGPQYLIDAVPLIQQSNLTDFSVFIVGRDLGLRKQLEQKVEELKIENLVRFLGEVDDKELKTLYSAADVVVFLDCSPYGCLGLVMVEAMACRTPVIAFNVCGVPEATIDGETGFLIPMGDVNQLSEKIITMIRNPELSEKMGNNGRSRVENVFATSSIALQYKKLLVDMVDRKNDS